MFGLGYIELVLLGTLALGALVSLALFVSAIVTGSGKARADMAPCPTCGKHIPRLTAVCHFCGRSL